MADYYPLIARAIAGLDPSAPGESRRALYERARAALIQQLRSVQPPLSESEITRERLSLEEAVRKVESEAAQRAREASRSGGARDAFRRATPTRPQNAGGPGGASASPPPRPRRARGRPRPPRDQRPPLGQDDRSQRNLRPDAPPPIAPRPQPPQPQVSMQEPQLSSPAAGAARRAAGLTWPPPPPPAPGMRGFRDIAADADDLGRAAAQASRNARKTYANVPSPSPEFDRLEPSLENRGADPDAPYSYDELIEEAERYAPQSPQMPQPPTRSRIGSSGEREPTKRARTGAVFPFKSAIAVGIVLILVGAGILWGKSAVTTVTGLFKSQPVAEAPKDTGRAGVAAENSRSRRPAVVVGPGRAGGAARGAV